MSNEHKYWIGVVARDDVTVYVAQGYAQLGHGKAAPLERMRAGDGLVFYSPRAVDPKGPPLQAFTAIGRVRTGGIYRASVAQARVERALPDLFRIDVEYFAASPAPIAPLIEALSFIRSKKHWGAPFRFGLVRVPESDFALIAAAMNCVFPQVLSPTARTSGGLSEPEASTSSSSTASALS